MMRKEIKLQAMAKGITLMVQIMCRQYLISLEHLHSTLLLLQQKIKNAVVTRWVVYNFNNPADPANAYQPSPDNSHNYHFSTGGSSFGADPFIPLQNLGVDGNPATECIYMGNGISNNTSTWRVSFPQRVGKY